MYRGVKKLLRCIKIVNNEIKMKIEYLFLYKFD